MVPSLVMLPTGWVALTVRRHFSLDSLLVETLLLRSKVRKALSNRRCPHSALRFRRAFAVSMMSSILKGQKRFSAFRSSSLQYPWPA